METFFYSLEKSVFHRVRLANPMLDVGSSFITFGEAEHSCHSRSFHAALLL
jgi:hypothetical protein